MFKLEINVDGVIKHRYWMNKHSDDFLQFMPRFFTREYGILIKSEDITSYLIDEINHDLIEGKLKVLSESLKIPKGKLLGYSVGKIKVIIKDKAKYKTGDKVSLEEYELIRLRRDEKFKDSKEKDKLKTKAPKSNKEDFVTGIAEDGTDIIENIDVVTVEATDDLAIDAESLEMELIGQKLKQWPYDEKGKFLGNK